MAWQLWHLTEIFSACQPRWSSGMPRKAATKIMLDNDLGARGGKFGLGRGNGAAERADERLLGRVPLRLAPAGRAGEFFWAVASGINRGMMFRGIGKRKHCQRNDCQRNGKKTMFLKFIPLTIIPLTIFFDGCEFNFRVIEVDPLDCLEIGQCQEPAQMVLDVALDFP
jgi:hypothetical protein